MLKWPQELVLCAQILDSLDAVRHLSVLFGVTLRSKLCCLQVELGTNPICPDVQNHPQMVVYLSLLPFNIVVAFVGSSFTRFFAYT